MDNPDTTPRSEQIVEALSNAVHDIDVITRNSAFRPQGPIDARNALDACRSNAISTPMTRVSYPEVKRSSIPRRQQPPASNA